MVFILEKYQVVIYECTALLAEEYLLYAKTRYALYETTKINNNRSANFFKTHSLLIEDIIIIPEFNNNSDTLDFVS